MRNGVRKSLIGVNRGEIVRWKNGGRIFILKRIKMECFLEANVGLMKVFFKKKRDVR